jgi:hypothetical protein
MQHKTLFTSLTALALIGTLQADIKIEAYGYAKLEMQYNSCNTGSFPSPAPTSVPLDSDKADQHGELIIDARESRLGLRATDEIKNVKMSGVVEGDFFTGDGSALVSNSRHFRLRMAYGRADFDPGFFFLAGQYWSLYMNDTIGQPNLIDFNGPVGAPYARQPGFRFGYQTANDPCSCSTGTFLFQASVEKQAMNTLGITNANSVADPVQGSGFYVPLAVGKLSWLSKYFQIEAAVAGSQNVAITNTSGRQTKTGVWAAETSAQLNVNKLTVYGTYNYLSGLSRLNSEDFLDCVLDANNNIKPVKSQGWYAGGSWAFTKTTSFNAVYGWNKAKDIPGSLNSGLAYGKYTSIHANILHQFWERWQTGIEYQRFDVRTFNGQKGHVDIAHTAIYYFF